MADEQNQTTEEAKAPVKAVKPSKARAAAERAVERFTADHLRNSDFARDTPAWNHFQAGLPVLIGYFEQEMEG